MSVLDESPASSLRAYAEYIKLNTDIVQYIGQTISLKRHGKVYRGATSASSKSGASMVVDPEKQLYTNFATGTGGDIYTWIAESEGLDIKNDFLTIVKIAADYAGIEFGSRDIKDNGERGELYTILKFIFEFYHSQLTQEHRKYIQSKWGISDETIDTLKIGYAPENCHLQKKLEDLFHEDQLKITGLFTVTDKGKLKDHYRDRIIFPYWKNGKPVYSIGRDPKWHEGKHSGKYIKHLVYSEERPYISPHIDNSVFYGEDSIKKTKVVYITEGVTDCIGLLQEGLACISPVTTQISSHDTEHAIEVCKNMDLVRIINDNEENESGLKGALKTAELLEENGIKAEIIELPKPMGIDKIDLAEYLLTHSKEDVLQLKGKRVWDVKLQRQAIPEDYVDKVEAANKFIQKELSFVPGNLIEAIATENVMSFFGIKKVKELSPGLKALKKSPNVKTDRYTPADCGQDILDKHHIFVMQDTIEYYLYSNGVFRNIGARKTALPIRKEIRELYKSVCGRDPSSGYIADVLTYLEDVAHIPRESIKNDTENICLLNGVYNIPRGKLLPHSPDYMFIRQIPVKYDPSAKCPNIQRYINEAVDKTDHKVLFEFLGYSLIPDTRIQKGILLIGDGGNGKSVFLDLVGKLVGEANCSHQSLHKLESSQYAAAELYGKLVNKSPDLKSQAIYQNEVTLQAIGDDGKVNGRKIYCPPFDFKNTARFIFSANRLPPVPVGEDFAFFRRWIIIRFPNKFSGTGKEDPELKSKLFTDKELSGLLNIALPALKHLLENGKYSYDATVEDVAKMYRINSDPIAAFADSSLVYSEDGCEKTVLYAEFVSWCKKQGVEKIHENTFAKRFRKLGYDDYQVSSGVDRGKRVWQNCSIVKHLSQGNQSTLLQQKQEQDTTCNKVTSKKEHCCIGNSNNDGNEKENKNGLKEEWDNTLLPCYTDSRNPIQEECFDVSQGDSSFLLQLDLNSPDQALKIRELKQFIGGRSDQREHRRNLEYDKIGWDFCKAHKDVYKNPGEISQLVEKLAQEGKI
ncbi:MAG: hypothetical protein JXA38_05630 [Methanosarcinaceae archaeon]|nr:hypothetical protein [Methanosarcinaceae archaeon]